jgi:hypothetical protein
VTNWSDTDRRALRGGLIVLAVPAAVIAVWALAAPHSFYADFPGGGHAWVAPLGPYDQHLVRDVGAFELGLVALAAYAFVTVDRRVVQAALLTFAVSGLPHLVYHFTTADELKTVDNVVSLTGLALPLIVPLVLLPTLRRGRAQR